MTKTFRCAHCGGTFEQGWSEEEARAEYGENFPTFAAEDVDLAVVCDDCYNLLMPKIRALDESPK